MRISEVAKLTGLSVSNIRFYEKKGLLAPDREMESQYRDYSEEDIEQLKRIILFRKMDIPIESIYLVLAREVSLASVLKRQEEELLAKQEMLQGSIDLCRQILKEQNPEDIDIEYYLNYVKEEEEHGRRFGEMEELLEDLAEFSRLAPFRGDPYVGRFFRNVWLIRGLSLAMIAYAVFLPLAVVLKSFDTDAQWNPGAAAWWILWLIALGASWIRFRKNKREQ